MKSAQSLFIFFTGLFFSTSLPAQVLTADAGNNTTLCPGTTYTVGGSPAASGGTAPYTYQWSPNTNISSTTTANPLVSPSSPMWYYLTVTDAMGNTAVDSVGVDFYPIYAYNGGKDTSICIGGTATLGDPRNSLFGGSTYTWAPATGLDNPSAPRPVTSTTVTTTYTVTITSPNCPNKSFTVTVTVNPLPIISACCNVTINEGEATILTATGGMFYYWSPSAGLSNSSASPTTAEPLQTTTYLVIGEDANGCLNYDTARVTVLPSSELYFYNTFSPNADGVNDFFYIGNIGKYPTCRLEVYTRTGQLVYAKTGYDNSWDGTNYGDKLPEATYYYSFDPGDGSARKFGNVTIVR